MIYITCEMKLKSIYDVAVDMSMDEWNALTDEQRFEILDKKTDWTDVLGNAEEEELEILAATGGL